jgi:hypothetical protein
MPFLRRLILVSVLAFAQFSHAPVAVAQGAEADLASLGLSAGTLSPGFSAQTARYSATVPYGTTSLVLEAETASGSAQVRARLNGGVSRAPLPTTLNLRPGVNWVHLRVTSAEPALADFPLAAGATRNLALHPEGRLVAWGVTATDDAGPALPLSSQSGVTAVFAGPSAEFFIADGALHRLSGPLPPSELGPGVAGVTQPKVVAAAMSSGVSIALREDGSIRTWGSVGQSLETGAATGTVAVAVGDNHYLALDARGRVRANGNDNTYGQLTVPAAAQSDVVAIAAHRHRNLALRADGTLVQWGQVSSAQAAIPPPTAPSRPRGRRPSPPSSPAPIRACRWSRSSIRASATSSSSASPATSPKPTKSVPSNTAPPTSGRRFSSCSATKPAAP